MPYGQAQTIGSGFNPAMNIVDYTGHVDAAKTQAQGISNAVGMVASAVVDKADEQKKYKQQVTSSKQTAKAIAQLIPELQPILDEQVQFMSNEEVPLSERAGAAASITDILNLGTAEIKARAFLGLEKAKLGIEQGRLIQELSKPQPTSLSKPFPVPDGRGGEMMMQYDEVTGATIPANFYGADDPTLQDLQLDQNGDPLPADDGIVLPPRIGYKPPTGGQGQVMTAKQIKELSKMGMNYKATPVGDGQFNVTEVKSSAPFVNVDARNQPTPALGYRNVYDDLGNLLRQEIIPGSPADNEEKGATGKKEAAQIASVRQGTKQVQDLYRARTALDEIPIQNEGPVGGVGRKITGIIPNSSVDRINKTYLDSVKATLSLQALAEMRANSPTGSSGLGQVTEREHQMLIDSFGALRTEGNLSDLKLNIDRLITNTLDAVHGTREQRAQMVQEGKVTTAVNDAINEMYPPTSMDFRGNPVSRTPIPLKTDTGADLLDNDYQKMRQELFGN